MGLFDLLKRKGPKNSKYASMLNGYAPIFSQFGNDIYASDVVQQAINCIVSEIKKLNPLHVRMLGVDPVPVNSDIQRVLQKPNPLMTTTEFIEKIMWQLMLNYNSFIIPVYYTWKDKNGFEQKRYTAFYPIQPCQVDFIEDSTNTLFVKFTFVNNFTTTIPYNEVIHIRSHYSVNEYMGGNDFGQPDNNALLKTLNLNHQLLEGISKALNASFAINGVVKFKTMLDNGKTEKALKELEEKISHSASGFLPLDLSAEFIPLERKIEIVDEGTLKFIDEKILRNFGVPLAILTGDYTKEQYEAFYQKTLEPIVIALSQAFTRTLFSDTERSFGNKIQFYPKDLIFMSIDQTLEMVRLLGDSGSLYENEKRVAFGLRPLPELEGVRMQSLNYVNVELAAKYQTGEKSDDSNGDDQKNKDDNSVDDNEPDDTAGKKGEEK